MRGTISTRVQRKGQLSSPWGLLQGQPNGPGGGRKRAGECLPCHPCEPQMERYKKVLSFLRWCREVCRKGSKAGKGTPPTFPQAASRRMTLLHFLSRLLGTDPQQAPLLGQHPIRSCRQGSSECLSAPPEAFRGAHKGKDAYWEHKQQLSFERFLTTKNRRQNKSKWSFKARLLYLLTRRKEKKNLEIKEIKSMDFIHEH